MEQKLGPTGNFPHGKITDDDAGELVVGIAKDERGFVFVNFGVPIRWFMMTPDSAIGFARNIMAHAGVKSVTLEMSEGDDVG